MHIAYLQQFSLFLANSLHSWPNVIGFLSWLVDLVGICSCEKLRTIMFTSQEDEDMPENILDSQVLIKTIKLYS
jgi:SMC interacting uncharacterized protein involved in chromosome segregation